jgi:site-specific recombinase XerD
VLTIYFVEPGGSLDEMKRIYREQDEKRYPGRVLQHLDERLHQVRVVLARTTTFRTLLSSAEDNARIVVDSLEAMGMCNAEFARAYEKRLLAGVSIRLLKGNLLLSPYEPFTTAFLEAILSTHAQKARGGKGPSLVETNGPEFVEALRGERLGGMVLRDIATKHGVSVASVHHYTKGINAKARSSAEAAEETPGLTSAPRLTADSLPPKERLDKLVELFVASQRKANTARSYQKHLETFRAYCRKALGEELGGVEKLTIESAVRFKEHRLEIGKKPTTVASELRALRAFLEFCVDEGAIPKNPLARLKIPKIERHILTEPLTRSETAKVIAAAEDMLREAAPLNAGARWKAHRDLLAIYLLSGVGMRHSGLLSLRKCDYASSSRGKTLAVASKANADRYTVSISRYVAEAVEAYIDRYLGGDPPEAYLFHPTPLAKDRPMSLAASSLRIAVVFDRAGITPRVPGAKLRRAHSLRVSWARFAYETGVDIRTIQMKLNHKNIEQTYAYLKIDEKEVETTWLPQLRVTYSRESGVSH